jgi:type IV pilus assembly protein PilB
MREMAIRGAGLPERETTTELGADDDTAGDFADDGVICEEIGRAVVATGALSAAVMLEVLTRCEPDPIRCAMELITRHHLPRQVWVDAMAKVTGLVRNDPAETLSLRTALPEWVADLETYGLTRAWALAHCAVPIRRDSDEWLVITPEARARERHNAQSVISAPIRWVASDPLTVASVIDALWRCDRRIAALIQTASADLAKGLSPEVVELVDLLITQAVRDRASDLHIEPGRGHCRIRVRVDGHLKDLFQVPMGAHSAMASRLKVMAQMDIVERRIPQDGTCAVEIDGGHLDIRVASLPTVLGEKLVLRLLPAEMAVTDLGDLGMDTVTLARYRNVLNAHDGVILCAGPTGAGKTTSLFASLAAINHPSRNIITIEDPVEYLLSGITQVQTNDRAGLGFANGLRALLRQDPDVLLVGEIRDPDTASIAMQAALTGHLVLSSVHGTDAVTGLYRLIDMGVAPYLVASAVRAVMAQRLIRLNCSACTRPHQPQRTEIDVLHRHGIDEVPEHLWSAQGCEECLGTGFRGRSGVYELMVMSAGIRDLILAGATAMEVHSLAITEGMTTMATSAMALVAQGSSSLGEVSEVFHLALEVLDVGGQS